MPSSASTLLVFGLGGAAGRRFHDQHYHKHAHTYLQFCANATSASSHACVHKVSAKWPTPAQLDPQECKESAAPYASVGTNQPWCAAGSEVLVNIYDPITIPQGLLHPNVDYRRGSDVDTLTDWDRIRCRDGQLFATGWYKKYTPMECARLCSKIFNFYGKTCTHFARQWIQSRVPEHSDSCGRDGEEIASDMPAHGAWGSAGTGAGTYAYRGQCLFFNSPNDQCCSTKAAWREAGGDMDNNYCEGKYGERKDAWDSKHRSWRLKTQAFTPTEAWPVTSLGRRLSDEASQVKYDGEASNVHEIFFPNGTRFWVDEVGEPVDEEPIPSPEEAREQQQQQQGRQLSAEPEQFGEQLWHAVSDAWQSLWR